MKKWVAFLLACAMILSAAVALAEPTGTVMLYSSLKEKQLVAVKEAFEAKYPGIVMDYYQAGKTDLLVTWLYKLTVDQHDYALASTIGIFIFMIVSSCSLAVYNRTGAVRREDQFQ